MRLVLFFFLMIFAVLPLSAGKFEAFCDEFEFLRKHLNKSSIGGKNSDNRQRIVDRAMQAGADASDIQQCATELGIRDITLGNDFSQMCQAFPVLGGSRNKDTISVRWKYVSSIRRQIQLLKSIKFNYEKRTFVRPDGSGTGRMDALEKLEKMLSKLEKELLQYKKFNLGVLSWFKNQHEEFQELTTKIDKKAKSDGLRLPSTYNLPRHAQLYTDSLQRYFESRKRGNKNKESNSPGVAKQYIYARDCILEDIKILRKAGFEMLTMDQPIVAPARGAASAPSFAPASSVQVSPRRGGLPELIRELDARKERVFRSERRMNGVSRRYYEKYRSLLTESQAAAMDSAYRKALDQQYPPELARADAVLKAHTKYRGIWKGATVQEVQTLLSKGE